MMQLLAQIPEINAQAPPGLEGVAAQVLGWMKWGGLILGVIGLMIIGYMMIIGRRNRSATAIDGAAGIPWVIGGLTAISLSGSLVGAVLT